ncbi:hypothetical protein GOV12_05730 [Candidatus Pacearchaeota archaeon]|nr:hypothetical protein [Candidatus Pacearchaeota archaeon]
MVELLRNLRLRLISEKDISEYLESYMENLNSEAGYFLRLEGKSHKGFNDWSRDLMYQDTDYSLALRGEKVPIVVEGCPSYGGRVALIGFNAICDDLRIEQIQANNRASEHIPKRFERMMVDFLKKFGKAEGFERLRIQRAEDNKNYNRSPGIRNELEFKTSMKIRYNVTAKRSGFKFDESLGDFVFNL